MTSLAKPNGRCSRHGTCLDLFVAQNVPFAVALRIIWPNFYPRSGNSVRRYTTCFIVSMEVHSDWKMHHDSL